MLGRRRPRQHAHSRLATRRLLEAALAGDADALRRFVEEFWERAFRIGFLISQDSGAAEDIAQETMVAALRSLERFDLDRPFLPWLDRIAARRAHDWVRGRSRRPEVIAPVEESSDGEETTTAVDFGRPLELSAVGSALAQLNLEQREAIVFRHLLDYEPAEIAALNGIPVGTVRSRLHRGLARMRKDLDEQAERSRDERTG